ncbi:hypothetical protein DYB25_004896, partial [Aphanomyces astaci]
FYNVLDRNALPFLQRMVQLILSDQTNATEKATAQKYLYSFLMNVVQHRLTGVLGSPANAASLPQVFQLILDGFSMELHIIRAVSTFCQNLVEHAFKENANLLADHRDHVRLFLLQDVLPLLFQVVHTKEFNARDAQSLIVLRDVAKLQVAIYGSALREDLMHALRAYFATISMPVQLVDEYCDAVRSENVSNVVSKYAAFVQS